MPSTFTETVSDALGARRTWICAGFLLLFALRFGLDPDWRISVVADDAFYYTETAKWFVATGVPSLDGLHPTNGFHPLLFFLNVGLAALGVEHVYLANVALGLAGLTASVYLLTEFARTCGLSRELASLLGLALFLWPSVFSSAASGVEVGMYLPVLILYYVLGAKLVRTWREETAIGVGPYLGLGVVGGLAYLARGEFLLHLGSLVLLTSLAGARRERDSWGRFARVVAAIWGPVVASWSAFAAFSWSTTGHLLQSSSSQKTIVADLVAHPAGAPNALYETAVTFLSYFSYYGLLPFAFLVLTVAGVWVAIRWGRDEMPSVETTGTNDIAWFTAAGTVPALLFYLFCTPLFQFHYNLSIVGGGLLVVSTLFGQWGRVRLRWIHFASVLALVLCVGTLIVGRLSAPGLPTFLDIGFTLTALVWMAWDYSVGRGTEREDIRRTLTAGCVVGGIAATTAFVVLGVEMHPSHPDRRAVADRLNAVAQERTGEEPLVVGARAAGILAKFTDSEDVRVVNLDGAISWPALEALREQRMGAFMVEAEVDYVVGPLPGAPEKLGLDCREAFSHRGIPVTSCRPETADGEN